MLTETQAQLDAPILQEIQPLPSRSQDKDKLVELWLLSIPQISPVKEPAKVTLVLKEETSWQVLRVWMLWASDILVVFVDTIVSYDCFSEAIVRQERWAKGCQQ
eukprot:Skav211894  [mRNA]  locus=scaffold2021:16647:17535:- [translate_table: standard]